MRHLFDIPLGASYAPNAVHKRIFNLLSSIVTGAMNSGNVAATNEMNYFMNNATNNANERINESQLAWAKEQYEQEKAENRFLVDQAYERNRADIENERAYNDPAAVMQRYRDAGINPYLASSLGIASGSSHVAGGSATVGSPAHSNQPNAIPMQTGAPMQAYQFENFGNGIQADLQSYLSLKQNEREDYRLASDITFQDYKNRIDYLEYRLNASKNRTETSYIKKQMDALDKEMALNQSKFEQGVEWQNFQKEVEKYRLRQTDSELAIKRYLANNEVSLGAATIEKLAAESNYLYDSAFEMTQSGISKREIDEWVKKQESSIANILRDDELQRKFNGGKGLGVYTRFANWLLQPIKGVLSGNASVKPK